MPGPYVSGVPYATLADFQQTGLPSTATSGIDDTVITDALKRASDTVSGSMQSQFKLPLLTIGEDIKQLTIDLAAGLILDSIGEAPEGESYRTWHSRVKDARELARQIREREYHPPWVVDSASPVNIQPGPQATPLNTGWNSRCITGG